MTRTPVKIIKMIALVRSPGELKAVFDQLRARQIQVFPINSFESAMKVLESGAVDYCLLSVDYAEIDIYDHPQKIETELKVPVIAISELRDKQSMWRLTKVKTKNTLYSKANAQNIFSRIQLIKKIQKDTLAKEAQQAAAAKRAQAAKQHDELRAEARRKAEVEVRPTSVVLIQGPRGAEKKLRLLTPPQNKSNGTVKLTEDVKLSLIPVKTIFTEIVADEVKQKASFIRTDFRSQRSFFDREVQYQSKKSLLLLEDESDQADETADFCLVEEEFRPAAESLGPAAPPEDVQKVILGCLKNALGEFCNPNELRSSASEFGRSMVISVNSKNLVGTFIISAETDLPKLGDVQTQLYEYLRTFGFDWQQEEIKVELLTDQKVPLELIRSGVYVSGFAEGGEVAISYYSEAVKVPELGLTNNTQHMIDPNNLVSGTRLNFDVFLHLRVNSRDLHYLKMGSTIDQKQIEKLTASGLTPWVPRNQLSNLNEYVLLQRLLKLMNPDASTDEIEEMLRVS